MWGLTGIIWQIAGSFEEPAICLSVDNSGKVVDKGSFLWKRRGLPSVS